jgi:hypothetical protein
MLKIKKIQPLFNSIVTTMDKYEQDVHTQGGLIDVSKREGGLKEYQKVISVGDSVRTIKVGDLVCVNPARFAVKKHQPGSLKDGVVTDNPVVTYNFDVIELDDKQCLLLQDRDIDFIIEDYEEIPDPTESTIIMPQEKKIIL